MKEVDVKIEIRNIIKTAKFFPKLLLKHQFFLSHRSHLINLNYVESLKSEFEIRVLTVIAVIIIIPPMIA